MTEEKKLTGIEKMRKRKEIVQTIGFVVFVMAGVVALILAMQMGMWQDLLDKQYLTNPDLPISEWKNATFTLTHERINHLIMENAVYTVGALAVAAIGLGFGWAGLLTPTNVELHRMGCQGSANWKYCPECGLTLSHLEEKKKKD
jgi:ABC-type Fe3+ transport system permease subunit